MASHPRTQAVSSRQRLLKAAKRLFSSQGYEQTATSAIARNAGTSESQLMRYFGGKIGVLDALLDEAWADINRRVSKVSETGPTARDRILGVSGAVVAALARDPELATLVLFEGRRLRSEEPRINVPSGLTAFTAIVAGLVRHGQSAREIDPTLDADAVTSSLIGAAEAMIRDRLLVRGRGGRAFAEREISRTLEAMLSGFSGRASVRSRRLAATPAKRRSS
jgi:AcrR family transcriptional regulator